MAFDIFTAEISRDELGLTPLDINDHLNYWVGDTILGGQQTWNRQSVKSPYVDGEYTVNRTRARVQENFQVQVIGDQVTMQNNLAALLAAVTQFRFQLRIQQDSAFYTFACETADYTIDWTKARMMAGQALVTLGIPRSPKLVAGGW